jgi:hypothetical protein
MSRASFKQSGGAHGCFTTGIFNPIDVMDLVDYTDAINDSYSKRSSDYSAGSTRSPQEGGRH